MFLCTVSGLILERLHGNRNFVCWCCLWTFFLGVYFSKRLFKYLCVNSIGTLVVTGQVFRDWVAYQWAWAGLIGLFICLVKFCYYFFIKEYHCDCSLFLLIELLQLLLALMTLLLCKPIFLLLMLQDFTFLFQERQIDENSNINRAAEF